MRNKVTFISALILSFTALLTLSSCDQDDPYYSPLVGGWISSYDNAGPINVYNYDYYNEYYFYDNGTGQYCYYDNYRNLVAISFVWTSYNDNYVNIRYETGDSFNFYYHFINGYLEFSNQSNFATYTGYSPRY